MSLPITARVKRAPKKGCGCTEACSCKKTPAKSIAYAAIKAANRGEKTFEYAGQTRKVTASPDSGVKKLYSPAQKNCGMRY